MSDGFSMHATHIVDVMYMCSGGDWENMSEGSNISPSMS